MADTSLRSDCAPRNPATRGSDLAGELRDCAQHAAALEAILTDVRAVLEAIDHGDLLAALPADEEDARRHNSAAALLDLACHRLADEEVIPGTDLSIKLHVMASCRSRQDRSIRETV